LTLHVFRGTMSYENSNGGDVDSISRVNLVLCIVCVSTTVFGTVLGGIILNAIV